EHRAEQVDRIGQPSPVEDEGGQRGGPDVRGGRGHRPWVAADARVVAFEQLVVTVLVGGMLDRGAAQPEQVGREVISVPGRTEYPYSAGEFVARRFRGRRQRPDGPDGPGGPGGDEQPRDDATDQERG